MIGRKVCFNESIEYITSSCRTTTTEKDQSEEEKKQRWWLAKEMERLRLDARMSCLAAAQKENHDVVLAKGLGEALRMAKRRIGSKLFHASSGRYMYSSSSNTGQDLQDIDVNIIVVLWSRHSQSHRGLEMTVSPFYQKMVRKTQRSRVQTVLKLYKAGANEDQVRKASEIQSLPSRIFARQMGTADALVARCGCHQLTELGSCSSSGLDDATIQRDMAIHTAALSAIMASPSQQSSSLNDSISHLDWIQDHECHRKRESISDGIFSGDNNINTNNSTAACTSPNLLDLVRLAQLTRQEDNRRNNSSWTPSLSSFSSFSTITTTTSSSSSSLSVSSSSASQ